MINRIFWDIDETLIFTSVNNKPEQECLSFVMDADLNHYYTIVRPYAKRLIDFSRSLVGQDKVHILTSSSREYVQEINRLADFGFNKEDIFSREDIEDHTMFALYGDLSYNPHIFAHKNNVLIDNLPISANQSKIDFIGIFNTLDNYLNINNYYGVNYPHDTFEQDVKDFLLAKHA
jgi:hypothetical protein